MATDPRELLLRLRRENATLRERVGADAASTCEPGSLVRETVSRVRECLVEGDVRGALSILNGTTPHRFTAVYRFDGEMLVNLHVFDRLDADERLFPTIPVSASYCMYVRDPQRFFALEDSMADERVRAHPKREQVRSYCGIALLNEDGTIFGSLCHFDFAEVRVPEAAFDLLDEVGRVLQVELARTLTRPHAR
jgi:GAF domain-containing protein